MPKFSLFWAIGRFKQAGQTPESGWRGFYSAGLHVFELYGMIVHHLCPRWYLYVFELHGKIVHHLCPNMNFISFFMRKSNNRSIKHFQSGLKIAIRWRPKTVAASECFPSLSVLIMYYLSLSPRYILYYWSIDKYYISLSCPSEIPPSTLCLLFLKIVYLYIINWEFGRLVVKAMLWHVRAAIILISLRTSVGWSEFSLLAEILIRCFSMHWQKISNLYALYACTWCDQWTRVADEHNIRFQGPDLFTWYL